MTFAEVVVNVPTQRYRQTPSLDGQKPDVRSRLAQAFHYAIPTAMQGRLSVGHLVQVPFGKQEVQGIVIALSEQSPVQETRYITALVDETPVVSTAQVDLARWMCSHYLVPLFSALQVMLPPGLEQRSRLAISWRPGEVVPPNLPAETLRVANMLKEKGQLQSGQLGRHFPEATWRKALTQLTTRGLVTSTTKLTPPSVRAKIEQMVRIVTGQPRQALLASSLGRSSKETELLHLLWQSPQDSQLLDSLCAATGCSVATARSLEKRGLLRILPARTWVTLPPGPRQDQMDIPARYVAALEWLRRKAEQPQDAMGWRAATDLAPRDERALHEMGLILLRDEPALAALASPRDAILDAILELRRLDKYLPVLEFLTSEGKPVWVGAVYAETGATGAMLRELAESGLLAFLEEERLRDPLADLDFVPDRAPQLTPDQERVWETIQSDMESGRAFDGPYLLHGVTGSGKTEIYLRALEKATVAGRQAIVLVPEIALTAQTIRRFSARFPGRVTTIHSELSEGERYDQWRRIRSGGVDVVIGPRSAIFAPLPRLGLIVVDEEHEDAYKSGRLPAYHARDVALRRGRIEECPVILGSATPSLESYYEVMQGRGQLLELPQRVMGHCRQIESLSRRFHIAADPQSVHPLGPELAEACYIDLPAVEIVDLRDELRAGNRSIFSRPLQRELRRTLDQGEQAILFLNRRGMATVVSCRDCGYVVECPRCNVPMTYHGASVALVCHHCNHRIPSPTQCPQCRSRRIRYLGAGTERVEEEIHDLFPTARTLRWDRDVTGAKGAHQAILDRFIAHEADVLVGTQMIAKGLDLPLVTLVGVVLADTGLYLPDFRAAERTFQLMAQVAGRAGRSILGGCVVVQTYTPDHYSIQMAAHHDYRSFYSEELQRRRELGYPPFCRLARLTFSHADARVAQAEAEHLAGQLRAYLASEAPHQSAIAGPAPCFFARMRDKYRWQIIVRASDPSEALAHFLLPSGWRLEIDPASLL